MTTPTLAPSMRRNGAPVPPLPRFKADINGQTVTVELINVTPDIAAEYLTHNTHNRNSRERQIKLYAADMAAGDWSFTGAPITFADTGDLLDGQHRLHAIVMADVTIPLLVIRGLVRDAQDDTDGGIPRKFYDVLGLRGHSNASHLAALTRRVTAWEAGVYRNCNNYPATHAQLLRTLEAHPELPEIIQPARSAASGCGLPASVVAIAMWVFSNIDEEDSRFFFDRLGDGQNLAKGDPIFELRRTIATTAGVKGERNQTYLLAIVIKAWNAYRAGETVGLYRWRPGGSKPEAFPEPR